MLTLQEHFFECASCEAELNSLRQLKRLLRSLHPPQTRRDFPEAIAAQLTQAESPFAFWKSLLPLPHPPQRGRRLVTALALSGLTIFAVAAPFAPATQNQDFSSWTSLHQVEVPPTQSGDMLLSVMPPADVRLANFLTLPDTDEARRERTFAGQYAQPAQPDSVAAPLTDDAVRGYVQGDIAFAGYRTR